MLELLLAHRDFVDQLLAEGEQFGELLPFGRKNRGRAWISDFAILGDHLGVDAVRLGLKAHPSGAVAHPPLRGLLVAPPSEIGSKASWPSMG
jgi:hypothetical protein